MVCFLLLVFMTPVQNRFVLTHSRDFFHDTSTPVPSEMSRKCRYHGIQIDISTNWKRASIWPHVFWTGVIYKKVLRVQKDLPEAIF